MIRKFERALFALTILLKASIYWRGAGRWEGFDAGSWLEVFRATKSWSEIPGVRAYFASYHPPLSYLIARQIFRVVPDEVRAAQLMSTLAVIGAFALFRALLARLQLRDTLGGVVFLYLFFALPLVEWLQLEVSYDPLVFFWAVATLYLSVRAFWDQPSKPAGALLVLVLAAGLMTKFSGLFNFVLPALVIAVRRSWSRIPVALAVCALALLVVSPFYYSHYYKSEHEPFPVAMKWLSAAEVSQGIAHRHAIGNWRWLMNTLHAPPVGYSVIEPDGESFTHSMWFMIWKRVHGALGKPPPIVDAIGAFYANSFGYLLGAGTILFFLLWRRRPREWNQLGAILLANSLLLCAALIQFAARYPVYHWLLFKPKYITLAIAWIPFCAALIAGDLPRKKWLEIPILLLVAAFVIVNHALRVY